MRAARPADVDAIHRLITDNLEAGHLLPRTADDVARSIARFVVASAESTGQVVGCAELAPLSTGVAEVRSLVVAEAFRGRKIGPALVAQLAVDGTAQGYATLCAFTHEPSHFVRMGFTIVPHIWVPEKISHDCTSCALFRRCGQHAVMLPLRAGVAVGPEMPAAVIHGTRPAAGRRLALRPVAAEAIPA
jgi:N-acetylglutamate synthase-like GNAT family acetyltransferase